MGWNVLQPLSALLVWADDGVISRVPDPSGSICHLRFPAVTEDTLFSDQPMLKNPSEGDIIDAYGPCNFDPLGPESRPRRPQRDNQLADSGSLHLSFF